jgi:E-phenylitaconyl-CoA hydratase
VKIKKEHRREEEVMAIIYEKKGKVAFITIDRPQALNATDMETLQEIVEARRDFESDNNLRVAVLTGSGGKSFCAGMDLKKTMPPAGDPTRSVAAQFWNTETQYDWEMISAPVSKPMIAAVNGYCLGGGLELALTCEIRIASDNASFGAPEVKVGSMPGGGATQRLIRQLPLAIAAKMLFTGERIDARQALQWGLVSDVVPLDQLMPTAGKIAETIADSAPLSLKAIKTAIQEGQNLPLEKGLLIERFLYGMLRDTQDRIEGRKAFAEKRKPDYKGY